MRRQNPSEKKQRNHRFQRLMLAFSHRYPGTADANLALEKGEIHCRATSLGSGVRCGAGSNLAKKRFHQFTRSHSGKARPQSSRRRLP